MATETIEFDVEISYPKPPVKYPELAMLSLSIWMFALTFFPSIISLILIVIAYAEIIWIFWKLYRSMGYLECMSNLLSDLDEIRKGKSNKLKIRFIDLLRIDFYTIREQTINKIFERLPEETRIKKSGGKYTATNYNHETMATISAEWSTPSIAIARLEEKLEAVSDNE